MIISIFGMEEIPLIADMNLSVAPKKNGPFISYIATSSGYFRVFFISNKSTLSISSIIDLTLVNSAIFLINSKDERTTPTPIANTKSKKTVNKNVTIKIKLSLLGAFSKFLNASHSPMLYDTITNIAARDAIGINLT
ncbi:hypothetical protein D3C73_950600 [compost metagenome]